MLFEGMLEVKYLYSPTALRKVNTTYLHSVKYLFSVEFRGFCVFFLIIVSLLIAQSTFDTVIIILPFKRKKYLEEILLWGFFVYLLVLFCLCLVVIFFPTHNFTVSGSQCLLNSKIRISFVPNVFDSVPKP